ncbi:FMN-dependent NADH-azoreductase [Micromonospora globbae]|uniref:FMN-dependent NADH-azoreductase n=1 Tax=Micromonospora globbae TaxID=1894969 RepID=UPI0034334FAD
MPNLLHLDSSARTASFSRDLGARFARRWREAYPNGGYTYRDLTREPIPPIGEAWTQICDTMLAEQITDPARYREAVRTPAQHRAWDVVQPLLDELLAADVVLIGVPMYNFSVPASLKAWIDQVTFPRMNLAGKRFVVAGARGGSYVEGAPRAPYDHQERYLRDFLAGHFAVQDVRFVHAELTNARLDPGLAHLRDRHTASVTAALTRIEAVASELAAELEAVS